jgi:two-component system nitrogen regulation sensor histidine kinase NtrY
VSDGATGRAAPPRLWQRLAPLWRTFRVAIPPALAAVALALGPVEAPLSWALIGLSLAVSVWLAAGADRPLSLRLRAISSVLTAYREGDFSIRVRTEPPGTPLGDVLHELNEFGDALRRHRLGELEAWMVLHKVMAEVRAVVLAFDESGAVKLANAEAARVLGKAPDALTLERAATLGLSGLLVGNATRTLKDVSALGPGHWQLRRGTFRMAGQPHALVVLSDVSVALREEEREAWKRLIRVMGHEINNSLAPIVSVVDAIRNGIALDPRPDDWEEDLEAGLSVVARRAESLARFIADYSKLARLPPPRLAPLAVIDWVTRVSALEQRLSVRVEPGPDVEVLGDTDQLDQLLINLVKNAAEASLERQGGVRVSWVLLDSSVLHVRIDDDGPGVADTLNLFVPFFTTKPGGSGVGLVLARQIAEAHGGTLALETRADGSGARATLGLPIRSMPAPG